MNPLLESFALWLADYYFLTTALFTLALAAIFFLRQPAQRLAVAKSTIIASATTPAPRASTRVSACPATKTSRRKPISTAIGWCR